MKALVLLCLSCGMPPPDCVTPSGTDVWGPAHCESVETAVAVSAAALSPYLPELPGRVSTMGIVFHNAPSFPVSCSITGRECDRIAVTWCPEGHPERPIIEMVLPKWLELLPHEMAHAGLCPDNDYQHENPVWKVGVVE